MGRCQPAAPTGPAVIDAAAVRMRLDEGGTLEELCILRASRIFQRWETSISVSYSVLSLTKFMLMIAAVGHWLACAFFVLGWNMCGDGPGKYEQTWVTEYFDGSRPYLPQLSDTCGQGTPEQLGSVHVRAMYWSLATMSALGYGNGPAAWSDLEFLYSVFNQLIGACLSAAIFSNVRPLSEQRSSRIRQSLSDAQSSRSMPLNIISFDILFCRFYIYN